VSGEIRFALRGRFGGFELAAEASVPAKGVTALVGPSGSGKTTLLRCLAGLARAEGEVRVAGEVWQGEGRFVPTHRRGVGYVFQEPSLFPHLSVGRNLAYARRRAQGSAGPSLAEVVQMMGLENLIHRAPAALSGGERQRAAISRALLSHPSLLLMDEPLSSLDVDAKAELLPFLDELHQRLSLPVIYVSHDAAEVAMLADRVLRMDRGRITASSPDGARDEAAGVGDPLAPLTPSQVRALARAALAAGLEAPE
jgi:molybdate transport system ATP-binding protein